ncbi:hypothetical protein POVWA2_054950 [Plasmodium ovale wallikeri]|uniref:Uncharacterized protein n=1 Tax=Plasmodium ovale wallikeri TaxID=864142 RepID=A0A1A8ZVR2_PLAOA|nr:hypothetical protein POVWA2_054950 [Plasmodium ovale wallikeri]
MCACQDEQIWTKPRSRLYIHVYTFRLLRIYLRILSFQAKNPLFMHTPLAHHSHEYLLYDILGEKKKKKKKKARIRECVTDMRRMCRRGEVNAENEMYDMHKLMAQRKHTNN